MESPGWAVILISTSSFPSLCISLTTSKSPSHLSLPTVKRSQLSYPLYFSTLLTISSQQTIFFVTFHTTFLRTELDPCHTLQYTSKFTNALHVPIGSLEFLNTLIFVQMSFPAGLALFPIPCIRLKDARLFPAFWSLNTLVCTPSLAKEPRVGADCIIEEIFSTSPYYMPLVYNTFPYTSFGISASRLEFFWRCHPAWDHFL